MVMERIDEDEIYATIRSNGLSTIEHADAIVLETDRSLTLIKNVKSLQSETMKKGIMPEELPKIF
jgi:uncharacterized membrane protein YcaP (DUF421 family)